MNRYVHDLTLRDTASSNPLIPPGKAELADVVRRNHGVVYTRPWVVDLILDLTGYDADANLVDAVAVEPSCGTGGFLEPMARRLSASCRRQGRALQDCDRSLRAFELDPESVVTSQRRVEKALVSCGWGETESRNAAEGWIRQADFLLEPPNALAASGEGADFVIGNPPYIRLEDIGADVADLYRSLFKSMTGRADIYVGFYEKALRLLKPGGVCGFICSDRWMLNQFGNKLRKLITEGFGVEAVLEMHGADAFHDEVLAYPAITVIRRADQGRALVARLGRDSESNVANVLVDTARRVRLAPGGDGSPTFDAASGVVVEEWFKGSDPWPCVSRERLKLLKHLEASFLPIQDEATGTKVGIGVATGADKIYLTTDKNLVENDRLLPLALGKDTFTGDLKWSGHYLVNPWEPDGTLADLNRYPLLKAYFEKNGEALKRRNVGKRNALGWYRTIDKVHHALTGTPKLLIPDIKNVAHPVLDPGTLYPHHNLYFVTSREWDLKVLGGILLSQVGQFFIECYAVRMQGGYWRFQAQYLRRIRVPNPDAIDAQQALLLSKAFDERDVDAATGAALAVYGIDGIPD